MINNKIKEVEKKLDDLIKNSKWEEIKVKLPRELQDKYNNINNNFTYCFNISLIFYNGFEAIKNNQIDVSSDLKKWTNNCNRKLNNEIFHRLIATQFCSFFEGFISEMIDWSKGNNDKFKKKYEELNLSVKNDLMCYLKPSGKKQYDFPKYLMELYQIDGIDNSIIESLKDMISKRQVSSHENIKSTLDKENSGERLKVWFYSLLLFIHEMFYPLIQARKINEN